jgi:hypothetical protein
MSVTISLTPFYDRLIFRLQHKRECLGPATLDHWWMPIQSVYPTANSEPANFRAIIRGFWQLCRREGSHTETDVAESYLLAGLLPMARFIGCRRIVADARLRKCRVSRTESCEILDSLLAADSLMPMSEIEFRDGTRDVMGPCKMNEEDRALYGKFAENLFSSPVRQLPEDEAGALAELQRIWLSWSQGFARRRSRNADKRILDILSYEMRAALHRCYSAVWDLLLLPHLREEYRLPAESSKFLAFWHLEQSRESEVCSPSYFHLFHAQSFGLHPAGSLFIQTSTGRALIGDWIRSGGESSAEPYGRLLRGLYLAVYHYMERLDSSRIERAKTDNSMIYPARIQSTMLGT